MISDPFFFMVAIPAVLIVGISKGGFGGGLAVIAVPLMSLAIAPPQAAGILLPVLCVMDLYGIWVYHKTWDRRLIAILLPAGLVGIFVGAVSFQQLDEDAIRLLVGVLSIVFVVNSVLRERGSGTKTQKLSPWVGVPVGALSGFTSFLAHAGGPPITAYFLTLRLEKLAFVSTSVIFFSMVNYIKLFPYAWLGQLNSGNLSTSLILGPLAVIGVALGARLNKRMNDQWFRHMIHALLVLTGIKLLLDGLAVY